MQLYSKKEYILIPWHKTKEGRKIRAFLEPMLQKGTNIFISNIDTEIYILQIENLFLPITVNTKEYYNSYVCSMYSFLLYTEEEIRRHKKYILLFMVYPFLIFLKGWFFFSKVNKLVIVNNFLFSTNLYPHLTDIQIQKISNFLKERFPDYAIIFRSLNTYTENILSQKLRDMNFQFITSRSIYLFEPKSYKKMASKIRWNIKIDKHLRLQKDIKIVSHDNLKLSDAVQLKHLYDLLYLKKYSSFNPAFTISFFEQAIKEKNIALTAIQYKENLVGIVGVFKVKDIMTAPIVGYDTTLPKELGLYRILISLIIEESLSTNTLLHLSSGVGHFKRKRGAFQEIESMAVSCSHLPFYRQFIWKSIGFLLNNIGVPILKKYKL